LPQSIIDGSFRIWSMFIAVFQVHWEFHYFALLIIVKVSEAIFNACLNGSDLMVRGCTTFLLNEVVVLSKSIEVTLVLYLGGS